jgi:uncharacterized protein
MTTQRYSGFLPERHAIESFGQGGFRFGGMSHVGSILALPSGMHAIETPRPFRHDETLYDKVFAEAGQIDILLVGAGLAPLPIPKALRERLRSVGVSCDATTTAAAASTYNVLLAEGRRVASLLAAVD